MASYRLTRYFDADRYRRFWSLHGPDGCFHSIQQGLSQREKAKLIAGLVSVEIEETGDALGDLNLGNPFIDGATAAKLWARWAYLPTMGQRIRDGLEGCDFIAEDVPSGARDAQFVRNAKAISQRRFAYAAVLVLTPRMSDAELDAFDVAVEALPLRTVQFIVRFTADVEARAGFVRRLRERDGEFARYALPLLDCELLQWGEDMEAVLNVK